MHEHTLIEVTEGLPRRHQALGSSREKEDGQPAHR